MKSKDAFDDNYITGFNYSNYFGKQLGTSLWSLKYETIRIHPSSLQSLQLSFKKDRVANEGDFKKMVASKPIIIYYYLKNPVIEEITDPTLISQLNAIYNAKSYEGQTNIIVTSEDDNLPAILDVTAFKKID